MLHVVVSIQMHPQNFYDNNIRTVAKWTAFSQLFHAVPKKLQRLLNPFHTIIEAEDRFFKDVVC